MRAGWPTTMASHNVLCDTRQRICSFPLYLVWKQYRLCQNLLFMQLRCIAPCLTGEYQANMLSQSQELWGPMWTICTELPTHHAATVSWALAACEAQQMEIIHVDLMTSQAPASEMPILCHMDIWMDRQAHRSWCLACRPPKHSFQLWQWVIPSLPHCRTPLRAQFCQMTEPGHMENGHKWLQSCHVLSESCSHSKEILILLSKYQYLCSTKDLILHGACVSFPSLSNFLFIFFMTHMNSGNLS